MGSSVFFFFREILFGAFGRSFVRFLLFLYKVGRCRLGLCEVGRGRFVEVVRYVSGGIAIGGGFFFRGELCGFSRFNVVFV